MQYNGLFFFSRYVWFDYIGSLTFFHSQNKPDMIFQVDIVWIHVYTIISHYYIIDMGDPIPEP